MTFGSLFAGIGGMDLGLERAGMTVRWQVEIDPFCNRVLAKHWPNVVRHRDVREVGAHNLEPVDLICGGFPCQDISVAGGGAGLHGARSALWFEYLRILQELRPAWVLIENVPALRTRGIDTVLDGLGEAAYTTWPLVVGARHVGAPHRRDRVWIVGRLEDAAGGRRDAQPLRRPGAPAGDGAADDFGAGAAGTSEGLAHRSGAGLAGRRECAIGAGAEVTVPTGGGDVGELGHAAGAGRGAAWRAVDARESGAGALDVAAGAGEGLADGERARLEGHGTDTGRAEVPEPRHDGSSRRRHRWPSRPGEQQHEWEEPRTVEPPLGGAVDGLSQRLAGRHRRAALKALGNSVVPQVVERIGRAILEAA